ncbi:Calcium binding EGF domain containing protein, partial [Aphelenchoides avenae]
MIHWHFPVILYVFCAIDSGRGAEPPPLLIAAAAKGINLFNKSASANRQLIQIAPSKYAAAVDYWLKEKTVVWSDSHADTLHIRRYEGSFEWTDARVITTNAPQVDGLAIDWIHGLLFRSDLILMSIFVTDLGSLRERVLVGMDLEAPRAIALDPSCGVIFWSDWETHRIERAGMDGQERKVIASGDQVYWLNGLTLDLPANRIYWVEENTDMSTLKRGIYSSDYAGQDVRMISQSVTISRPFAIALHGDWLYWTDIQRHQVLTSTKEGEHISM